MTSSIKPVFLIALLLSSLYASCQESLSPIQLTPEQVKVLREQEKQFQQSINQQNTKSITYSVLQCRADTQRWTSDPFDRSDERNLSVNTGVLVNGQMRSMAPLTAHVDFRILLERIHEMSVCQEVDAEFQKQFNTYALIGKLYEEEKSFRYLKFLLDHSLYDQFLKEDAVANK